MLEDKDIQKLQNILATKEDLRKFATKKDLERFATKKDLRKFATKKDLERFATKKDLDERTTKLLREIFSTREDLKIFKEEVRKSFSDLYTAIDTYTKKVDTYAQEMILLAHKVDRHERWLRQIAEKLGIKLEY